MTLQSNSLIRTAAALAIAAGALFAASLSSQVSAQVPAGYPDKPVRIIVPFPPGGAADTFARMAGQKLSEAWGNKQVIIENRAGAGGIIGTEATAKAAPDGYTFLMVTIGHAVNPYMYSKLPYDTKAELTPVAVVANVPSLVVVGPGFAEVGPDRVTLLVDSCEVAEDIDKAAAQKVLELAERTLLDTEPDSGPWLDAHKQIELSRARIEA